ncbi:MAG: hypothetical protein AB3N15_03600 [Paracoccaceae bacterium]
MNMIVLTHGLGAVGTIRKSIKKLQPTMEAKVIGSYDDYSQGELYFTDGVDGFFGRRLDHWQATNLHASYKLKLDHVREVHSELVKSLKPEKLEFWSANTVQDEMFLIVALWMLDLEGFDLDRCSIRRTGAELSPHPLAVLHLNEMQGFFSESAANTVDIDLYSQARQAVSKNSFDEISRFVKKHTNELPLIRALQTLLLRSPQHNEGLGVIDRALLAGATLEFKNSAHTIGNAMGFLSDSIDLIGDAFLFNRLVELGTDSSDPLFVLRGDTKKIRTCEVQLTQKGEAVRERYSLSIF